MRCEIIVPVGTSLLSNWMRRLEPGVTYPRGWVVGGGLEGNAPKAEEWIPRLTAAMRDPNTRTSAELDSIRSWLNARQEVDVRRVTLLVSDTDAARWVAEVTQALLRSILHDQALIERRQVPRLGPESMRGGLVEFVRVSAQAIKDCRARDSFPVINATPGFKAEAALLTLSAALLGAESFYLHEQMQSIVTVPAIPLRWGLDESDIDLLRRIGGATTRDTARDLGLGQRPHLEPFVVREGQGAEEVWGLSALGELLVESAGAVEEEDPPERETEHAEILVKQDERGHMPADAEQIAQQVGDRFRFVNKVQIFCFDGRFRQGVLPPRNDEVEQRVIRIRLHSNRSTAERPQAFGARLYTTAKTDVQYREAVRRLNDAYGRISLHEYLLEDETRSAPPPAAPLAGPEFAALATEALLKRALDRRQADCERLNAKLADVQEALNRAQQSINDLKTRLNRKNDENRQLRATIEEQRAEIADLRQRLDAAGSPGPGGEATGHRS